jgi:hypothetical protein
MLADTIYVGSALGVLLVVLVVVLIVYLARRS